MSLQQLDNPTDSDILAWILHAKTLGSSYSTRAGALTAARENLGPKFFSIMLHKMNLETAMDVVEWLAQK